MGSMVEYDVVWSGSKATEGEGSKGLLMPARDQTPDERLTNHWRLGVLGYGETRITLSELARGVARLNASLKNPIDFEAENPFTGGIR